MDTSERWLTFAVALIIFLIATLFYPVFAHEHGRTDANWEKMSDEEKTWLMSLKQPDDETMSCCGLSDQYWCDIIHVREGKTYCTITDDRDDNQFTSPHGGPRPHIPVGTEIYIPDKKLKWKQGGKPIGNPTGHNIVFTSQALYVHCFVQSTGI